MTNDIEEIDILKIIKNNLKSIITFTVVFSFIFFVVSIVASKNAYSASALVYVKNSSNTNDMTESIQIALSTDAVYNRVIADLNLSYTTDEISQIVSVEPLKDSNFFRINVKDSNPQTALLIANRLAEMSETEINRYQSTASISIVDDATSTKKTKSLKTSVITLIGLIIGLCGSIFFFIIKSLFDKSIKDDDDLVSIYNIPLLSNIVDFNKI